MKGRFAADVFALVEAIERDPDLAARVGRAIAPFIFGAALEAAKRPGGVYSSRRGCGAPGYSDEESKRIARLIGIRRGRWHVYSAEQLAEYERGKNETPAAVRPSAWHPSQAAAAAGLRIVKAGER